MLIPRDIESELLTLIKEYPIVTILGPRQAGKTTLARNSLHNHLYANLEDPETRAFAEQDPKAFLNQFTAPVIFDEIQRVPALLSYLQVAVDHKKGTGHYVLTGSHQLSLRQAIGQSLAGRTAILNLLPLSIHELSNAGITFSRHEDYCYRGFLPRIYELDQRPTVALANYYQTYVERDVRQLIQLKDASLFEKMLKLLAGRVGQVFDYTSLSNDVGVDSKTIRNWMSILEASFIIFKLPPYFENFGKRIIKSPKYYFTDVGLLCYLLGIREPEQIRRDPLTGQIFENLVVMECLKTRYNQGKMADLYFYRDSKGNEVDIISPTGRKLTAIEIKSAATFSKDQLKGLYTLKKTAEEAIAFNYMVYSGQPYTLSNNITVINYTEIHKIKFS